MSQKIKKQEQIFFKKYIMYGMNEAPHPNLDKEALHLYLKYKNKYIDLKNQLGSAPISNLPSEILDNIDFKKEINLIGTNKKLMEEFAIKYSGYTSTFAPDIMIILNNIICNNQEECNKLITHYRIKDIMKRYRRPIPHDGQLVIPTLTTILIDTIRRNNKIDCEFLVSLGVTIINIVEDLFNRERLTNVYIPSSVINIGDRSFERNQLSIIDIPSSVNIIGNRAFYKNILTTVNFILPSSLTSIGNSAFSENRLTTIDIPSTVIRIGNSAFNASQLSTVTIPSSVEFIDAKAFSNNYLTTIQIPPLLKIIKNYTFSYNLLTSVIIPPSVTNIGNYAFLRNKLTTITLSPNLTEIGDYAFSENKLTTIYIPMSVITIGESPFYNNPLRTVSLPHHFKDQIERIFSLSYTKIIINYI